MENMRGTDVAFLEGRNTELLNRLSPDHALYSRSKQALSNVCSARKRRSREMLFKPVKYITRVSRYCSTPLDTTEIEKKEIEDAQR